MAIDELEAFIKAAEDFVDHTHKSWEEARPPLAEGQTSDSLWSPEFRRLSKACAAWRASTAAQEAPETQDEAGK